MSDFERAITDLDLDLFSKIDSQSTNNDKQSFLAIQLAVRKLRPGYKYLEIGSYLGGSIQPHLLDDQCARIYSIDKRPEKQPDARGFDYTYLNNSTQRMLEKLSTVSAEGLDKITTIDGDSRSISPSEINEKVDLCFIDGEHTDEAVLSDFNFCLEVLNESGCIAFHDAQITYTGIA
jgi:predicted O-methyltransferase YrrM